MFWSRSQRRIRAVSKLRRFQRNMDRLCTESARPRSPDESETENQSRMCWQITNDRGRTDERETEGKKDTRKREGELSREST